MRWVWFSLKTSAVIAVLGLLTLNWRAQLRTQEQLDALATALAERSPIPNPSPAPVEPPAPAAVVQVSPPGEVPPKNRQSPYLIEVTDVLAVELKDRPISVSSYHRPDGTIGLSVSLSVSEVIASGRERFQCERPGPWKSAGPLR
jgi:hypothetical protein